MSASPALTASLAGAPTRISRGLHRLGLVYLWITIASIGIVSIEPAPFDVLILGAMAAVAAARPHDLQQRHRALFLAVDDRGRRGLHRCDAGPRPRLSLLPHRDHAASRARHGDRYGLRRQPPCGQCPADHVGLYALGAGRWRCRHHRLFQPLPGRIRPPDRVWTGARHVQGPQCARCLSRARRGLRLQRRADATPRPGDALARGAPHPHVPASAHLLARRLDQPRRGARRLCLSHLRHRGPQLAAAEAHGLRGA